MNKINDLVESYKQKIDEIAKSNLNNDQKDLIKDILDTIAKKENVTEELIQNVYQLLIQRVKVGFTFDAAPTSKVDTVVYLQKDQKLSFGESASNQNTLIIGENYDALKCLLLIEGERERANAYYDVVYIDPPYNTESSAKDGNAIADDKENITNNTFIYRDKYSRSGWLNMLNERLLLAKKLLKDDGIIFVSIDDNEHAYLKILMDEIFGEENFIANFVWQKKNEGSAADSKYVKVLTEYVLMYSKNISVLKTDSQLINVEDGSYTLKDKHFKLRGFYKLKGLDVGSLSYSKNLDYEINVNGLSYWPGSNKENWIKRQTGMHTKKDWRWRWSKEKFEWGLKNDFIEFQNGKVFSKQYQFVDNEGKEIKRTTKYTNLILNYHGSKGTNELKNIFEIKNFDHPKPVDLIKYLLKLHTKKDIKVLDFFAGSGTTGHAVLELNQEDQQNRSFTLVTNNENNIATNITYERLYRINKGIGTKGENFQWSSKNTPYNSNLSVFNIQYLNIGLKETNQLNLLLRDANEMLKDFGIQNKIEDSNNLLSKLRSLKPLEDK
ncbi:putative type III restriction-modification system: methylase [Mycoplasmopsis columbina SF7]|uniref:Putative type III restriction-modification system: methylase n=1 Tax=Mycoplasmopsis columbina SF7 TaxID=1037410 RepID=F9UJB6_9BACT|nr:site-specific DNA-methyltransferase [Mycoplasmopsis columbina]EGV00459.1 putative type III restriction-modification system: methylase [Mycoplasmopsis columbina SF7]